MHTQPQSERELRDMDAEQVAKDLEAIAGEASASIMRAELRAYARKLGPEKLELPDSRFPGSTLTASLTGYGVVRLENRTRAASWVNIDLDPPDAVRLRDWLDRMVAE